MNLSREERKHRDELCTKLEREKIDAHKNDLEDLQNKLVLVRTYFPQHGDTSELFHVKQDYRGFKHDIKDLCLRSRELRYVRNAGEETLLSDDAATASNRHGNVMDSLRGL